MINNQDVSTGNTGIGNSNLPADLVPHKGNFFNLDASAIIPDIKLDLNFNGVVPEGATKSFST